MGPSTSVPRTLDYWFLANELQPGQNTVKVMVANGIHISGKNVRFCNSLPAEFTFDYDVVCLSGEPTNFRLDGTTLKWDNGQMFELYIKNSAYPEFYKIGSGGGSWVGTSSYSRYLTPGLNTFMVVCNGHWADLTFADGVLTRYVDFETAYLEIWV